ncbi:MAG: PH domain-containing protein, partial [Chloroflexota bacterium]
FALYRTFHTPVGPLFTVYLLFFIFTGIFVPIFAYRFYALSRANYYLDRNTLRIVWGLRVEELPVNEIEWIRPVAGLPAKINFPVFRFPGGILGVIRQAQDKNIPGISGSKVEFLASDQQTMVLAATASKIFAISPENPGVFLSAFQKTIEMGSLNPTERVSQFPSFIVSRAWDNPIARFLWLLGAFLNAGLLLWVTLIIPSLPAISLGFSASGGSSEPVPGAQLILLPVLSSLLFILGLFAGLFFYRKPDFYVLAHTLWISSVFSSLMFLVAVFFILSNPV